ncbi:TRC40/GET3/ArsA family transport-energizing ATPase [Candidatus Acidulodesulfobacterium sp. H_13]|uniref:TRC40/GET3/ArsA family transport-energizing ATPase n=1 Tax=Candidatus Acidulodesulfobacterium sp. H_13 TaxID=3395470 RepID=UPI003AF470BF
MHYYFFHGKGGVGKTTISSAFAVKLSLNGEKTLIVSTDPASNIGDVFEQNIGGVEKKIEGLNNLYAVEMDSDTEILKYKKRILGDSEDVLPQEVIGMIEEEFRSPCTSEIAFFNGFTEFFLKNDYDNIIFDTAPSAHTLRLLELPLEWTVYIDEVKKGAGMTCMGPVVNLGEYYDRYKTALNVLKNPKLTTFIFVMHPQELDLSEIKSSANEIKKLGITNIEIMVNAVFPYTLFDNSDFKELILSQQEILRQVNLLRYKTSKIYLKDGEVKGMTSLINFFSDNIERDRPDEKSSHFNDNLENIKEENNKLIEDITPLETPFYFFFTGKGGTGKTTSSLLFGKYFASTGKKTLIVSTDSSNHIAEIMGLTGLSEVPKKLDGNYELYAARISPAQAIDEYKVKTVEYFKLHSSNKDSLKVLEEELNSPCTEEVAVFKKFSSYFFEYKDFDVIIFDAAPTGHALRLLYISMEYAKADKKDSKLERFINILKNEKKTIFSLCLYPEFSPIEEAKRAYDDLKLAGVNVSFIVVNYILNDIFSDGLFKNRRKLQESYLLSIKRKFDVPAFLMPQCMGEINSPNALDLLYSTVI